MNIWVILGIVFMLDENTFALGLILLIIGLNSNSDD